MGQFDPYVAFVAFDLKTVAFVAFVFKTVKMCGIGGIVIVES